MNIRIIAYICAIVSLMILTTGCSDSTEQKKSEQQTQKQENQLVPPEEQPHIIGSITKLDDKKLMVEENPNEPAVTLKAEVALNDSTQYLIREGNQYKKGKKEDLKQGMKVEVWYQGITVDAYPIKTTGECVVYEQK